METDKLLQALKENKAIKDYKMFDTYGRVGVAVKITFNNDDTLALDYFGKKLMRSFKNKENKNGFRR